MLVLVVGWLADNRKVFTDSCDNQGIVFPVPFFHDEEERRISSTWARPLNGCEEAPSGVVAGDMDWIIVRALLLFGSA